MLIQGIHENQLKYQHWPILAIFLKEVSYVVYFRRNLMSPYYVEKRYYKSENPQFILASVVQLMRFKVVEAKLANNPRFLK